MRAPRSWRPPPTRRPERRCPGAQPAGGHGRPRPRTERQDRCHGQGRPEKERRTLVDEKLELVGLTQWRNKKPDELSGGMQQRVGLARALAMDADILLMDEPFGAVDPLVRRDLQNELLRIQSELGKTIVVDMICEPDLAARIKQLEAVGVRALAVHWLHRQKGLGRWLMSLSQHLAQQWQLRTIYLSVDCENMPARTLYERLGLQISGQLADYYGLNRHGLRMRLNLELND